MCGIWAVFGLDKCSHKYLHCFFNISHRGPDAYRLETVSEFPYCWLGFHHLSIVQDFHNMQPMRIKAFPHLRLLYNGEIYNHKSLYKTHSLNCLTNCDGEIMLHLYEKFGIHYLAEQLDGVFAFIIIDSKRNQLNLGRDQYGVRPLFTLYNDDKGILAVSSEVKGIFPLTEKEETCLDLDINSFKPGHYASYSLRNDRKVQLLETNRYTWVGKFPVFNLGIEPNPLSDIKENIRKFLKEAVNKRLMSDRRIGCLLSGGLDSSLVTALVVKCAKEAGIEYPVQTFTIGLPEGSDVIAARKVAMHIGTEHHCVTINKDEICDVINEVIYSLETYDGSVIHSALPMWLIASYIRKNKDSVVIFCGEGSDELTQGYLYFHNQPSVEEGDRESRKLLEQTFLMALLRADRVVSAHGLELRVPFLDLAFSSYYLSIDAELRRPRHGIEKFLLRSAFDGENLVPEDILWRQKQPFSEGISPHFQKEELFHCIQLTCEDFISQEEFQNAAEVYPFNTPLTKQEFYYRKVFEKYFPGQAKLIPFLWTPKWIQ